MADSQFIDKAIAEIETRNFGFTGQFLEVHELVFEQGRPKVVSVNAGNDRAVVYFPVKGEKFHFAVYVDEEPKISVSGIVIEPYTTLRFYASSDDLTLEQLSQITTLKPSGGRNKGDLMRPDGGTGMTWKNSNIFFEPDPGPGEFEDKLHKLLNLLEQDVNGAKRLVKEFNGFIRATMEYYISNTMLGGPLIDKKSLHRLSALDTEIDFDLYISGTPFH